MGPVGAVGLATSAGLGTVLGMRHALEPGWPLAKLGMHHVVTRTFSVVAGGVSVALGLSLGIAALRGGLF